MWKSVVASTAAIAVLVQPAAAYWVNCPDGSHRYIPNGLIAAAAALSVIAVTIICAIFSWLSESNRDPDAGRDDLAREYDDEAERYHAMSRQLDAETALAESLMRAKRTRAELDDIEAIFKRGKSRRRG
jgi:hypothetical protein